MQARLNPQTIAPEGYKALVALELYLHRSGLERPLIELVKLRASQINGCAYCIDMHTKDARAAGETEQRLTAYRRGANVRSTAIANGRRLNGPRRSRSSQLGTSPMRCSNACGGSSRIRNWST
jgi:AhpD family alkylhydroperoxidase